MTHKSPLEGYEKGILGVGCPGIDRFSNDPYLALLSNGRFYIEAPRL